MMHSLSHQTVLELQIARKRAHEKEYYYSDELLEARRGGNMFPSEIQADQRERDSAEQQIAFINSLLRVTCTEFTNR